MGKNCYRELGQVSPHIGFFLGRTSQQAAGFFTQRVVAIRDFYDIDHAIHSQSLSVLKPELVELVRAKLTVPGNEPVDVSGGRLKSLRLQVDTELKPVLRDQDFAEFDLDRAFERVVEVALALNRVA